MPKINKKSLSRPARFWRIFQSGASRESAATSGGSLQPYQYEPLPAAASTRIVEIQPSLDDPDAPLQCVIKAINVAEDPYYEAISYTWGGQLRTEKLMVNGGYEVSITRTIYDALHRFRQRLEVRRVWVDGICIDQDNDQDKGHQIPLMGLIFQRASRVLVWLGNESAIERDLREIDFYLRKSPSVDTEIPDDILSKCERLFLQPWFQRRWVVQEVVSNANVALFCAGFEMPWTRLTSHATAKVYTKEFDQSMHSSRILCAIAMTFHWKMFQTSSLELEDQSSQILHLLDTFFQSKCADDRDRIYALAGISSDLILTYGSKLGEPPSQDDESRNATIREDPDSRHHDKAMLPSGDLSRRSSSASFHLSGRENGVGETASSPVDLIIPQGFSEVNNGWSDFNVDGEIANDFSPSSKSSSAYTSSISEQTSSSTESDEKPGEICRFTIGVDYTKTVEEVYTDFAISCVQSAGVDPTNDAAQYNIATILQGVFRRRQDCAVSGLPSWVPDWRLPIMGCSQWFFAKGGSRIFSGFSVEEKTRIMTIHFNHDKYELTRHGLIDVTSRSLVFYDTTVDMEQIAPWLREVWTMIYAWITKHNGIWDYFLSVAKSCLVRQVLDVLVGLSMRWERKRQDRIEGLVNSLRFWMFDEKETTDRDDERLFHLIKFNVASLSLYISRPITTSSASRVGGFIWPLLGNCPPHAKPGDQIFALDWGHTALHYGLFREQYSTTWAILLRQVESVEVAPHGDQTAGLDATNKIVNEGAGAKTTINHDLNNNNNHNVRTEEKSETFQFIGHTEWSYLYRPIKKGTKQDSDSWYIKGKSYRSIRLK
ncbi:heterokaryon incompatibility protein-domain-containing protein [Xylariales sp. PMI_506]|nr:heterokaryon incompatibility protein-domain-containing protein [Xylariales sp. PMI_506]